MGSVSIKNIDEPGDLKDQDEVRLRNKALNLSAAGPLTMHGSLISLEGSESIYYIEGLGTLYGKDGWHFVYGKREVPEWEPGTVYEIDSGYGNPGEAAWCIRDLRGVIFVTADGDEFAPEELDSIQVLPDDTEALRAEVKRQTCQLEAANAEVGEMELEVKELRAARTLPTREQRGQVVDLLIAFSNDRGDAWDTADEILSLFEQGGAAATCPHGQAAEELCNRLPDDRTLTAMRLLWDSITPGGQRVWETRAEASADG